MLRRRKQISNPTVPGGLIARTEKGDFFVKGDKRFKFISNRARDSWKLKIIETNELAMQNIKIAGVIGFRDGTLIRDISSHKIYLISDYKKRHVVAPDIFKSLGYRMSDVILVSSKEAGVHQEGVVLNG
jgi:hypothetical protein